MNPKTVSQCAEQFALQITAGKGGLVNKVTNVYIGDLLSRVMNQAQEGCLWITIHGQINIVAVAALIEAACVVVCENAPIAEETRKRADSEGIPVLSTPLSAFALAEKIVRSQPEMPS